MRESPFPQAPVHHRVPHSLAQVEAAKAGMGLVILPCFLGDQEARLRRAHPDASPGFHVWLLTHRALRNTARVRRFMDFMSQAILRHRDLLEGRRPYAPELEEGRA